MEPIDAKAERVRRHNELSLARSVEFKAATVAFDAWVAAMKTGEAVCVQQRYSQAYDAHMMECTKLMSEMVAVREEITSLGERNSIGVPPA